MQASSTRNMPRHAKYKKLSQKSARANSLRRGRGKKFFRTLDKAPFRRYNFTQSASDCTKGHTTSGMAFRAVFFILQTDKENGV